MPTAARQMEQKSSTGENYTDYNLRNRACSQRFSLKKNIEIPFTETKISHKGKGGNRKGR